MKTFISIVILLMLSSQIYSQVVLTSSSNPVSGDFQMNVRCDTTSISEGVPGPNLVWNFSTLTRRDSTLTNWVNSSSTPYSASYPTSNVAWTTDTTIYNYYTTSSSNIIANGGAGPFSLVVYSDPEILMQYPFTYNSSFNDNFFATINSGTNIINRNGSISALGDAWGTLNLPFGSFNNAIRVKYIITSRDSIISGTPYVLKSTNTIYDWFVPGKKFPVFEIKYATFILNGNPLPGSKIVVFNSNSRAVGITPIGSTIPEKFSLSQNYPNPFNPVSNIKFDIPKSSFVKIIVYDATGREAEVLVNQQLQPGSYNTVFDGAILSSGIYFYKITAGEFFETKKMMLIK